MWDLKHKTKLNKLIDTNNQLVLETGGRVRGRRNRQTAFGFVCLFGLLQFK